MTAKRRRAGRVGRWLSRAVVVAGGVVAGTAAAWAISTAGASADTGQFDHGSSETAEGVRGTESTGPGELTPVTDSTINGIRSAATATADFIGDSSGAVIYAAQGSHRGALPTDESADGHDAQGQSTQDDAVDSVAGPDAVEGQAVSPVDGSTVQDSAGNAEPGTNAEPETDASAAPNAESDAANNRDKPKVPSHKERKHRVGINREVAERVSKAIDKFAQRAVLEPVRNTLGAVEHMARKPQDAPQVIQDGLTPPKEARDFGNAVWDWMHHKGADSGLIQEPERPVPGNDGTGSEPWQHDVPSSEPDAAQAGLQPVGQDLVNNPIAATENQTQNDQSLAVLNADSKLGKHTQSGLGEDNTPRPVSPRGWLPLSPATAPATPGSVIGGHFDGLPFGIPVASVSPFDSTAIGSAQSGFRHVPVQPGSQPGVAPD